MAVVLDRQNAPARARLTPNQSRLRFREVTLAIKRSTESLKLSFIEHLASSEAAFLRVDDLLGSILLVPVPRDESRAAVSTVNLERAVAHAGSLR